MYYFLKSSNFTLKDNFLILDIDGTLVYTKSGRLPYLLRSSSDWIFNTNIDILKEYKEYSIILMTNQRSLSNLIKNRLEQIFKALLDKKLEILLVVLTGQYRKPSPKIFEKFDQLPKKIIYVGDALGEDEPPYCQRSEDRDFFNAIPVDNKELLSPRKFFGISEFKGKSLFVILMGNPASGKSTLAYQLSNLGYNILRSKKDALKLNQQAYVVDMNNPSKADRQFWIDVAKSSGFSSYQIVWFVRDGRPWNAFKEKPYPEVAYNIYSKNFEEPEDADLIF